MHKTVFENAVFQKGLICPNLILTIFLLISSITLQFDQFHQSFMWKCVCPPIHQVSFLDRLEAGMVLRVTKLKHLHKWITLQFYHPKWMDYIYYELGSYLLYYRIEWQWNCSISLPRCHSQTRWQMLCYVLRGWTPSTIYNN